jgi:serine O-acetyltransferase
MQAVSAESRSAVRAMPFSSVREKAERGHEPGCFGSLSAVWSELVTAVYRVATEEPLLAGFLQTAVLRQGSLGSALSRLLATKLASPGVDVDVLESVCRSAFESDELLQHIAAADLVAVLMRDPATRSLAHPFLFHKGFHATQAHRIGHHLWDLGRQSLAMYLQGRVSEVFAVDIHPAAVIGPGLFIDHATGVVIGETCVIGRDVSLLQGVTLGGTGKERGDRHPKVGDGVLVCAGAKVLGNIRIGPGAKIGAGSVVLHAVPGHTTVVGVPARVAGRPGTDMPSLDMDQGIEGCGPNEGRNAASCAAGQGDQP